MENNFEKFIQQNSPDGGFLQSEEWRRFQENIGRKTYCVTPPSRVRDTSPPYRGGGNAPSPVRNTGHPLPSTGEEEFFFHANIIEHVLPVVGKYFYVPRGPVMPIHNSQFTIHNQFSSLNNQITKQIQEIINLAKKEKAGWVRIEPVDEEILEKMKIWTSDVQMHSGHPMSLRMVKAPHDVQPKEIFVIDITKPEEELLAGMKSKTRYNIRLAEKKGVKIFNFQFSNSNDQIPNKAYIDEFIRLVRVTATRDGIVSHPESYYRKMLENISGDILKLYVAEYQGKVIAANLVLFYGDTCTYMHGASDNENRNVMAPYALQWQQIQDAKKNGCVKYDFGGVKAELKPLRPDDYIGTPPLSTGEEEDRIQKKSWAGITRFKTGFSPETGSTRFPGSYDIIINPRMYWLYRSIQKLKSFIK